MAPIELIEQTEQVGTQEVTVRANPKVEYVASWPNTSLGITSAYVRTLPKPTDRFLRDFGAKIYTQDMMLDPQVYSTVMVKVTSLWAQGVQVLTPKRYADIPEAEEATRFCSDLLEGMDRPISAPGQQLTLRAIQVGNGTGELVWETRAWEQKQKLMLRTIKPRPYDNVRFVTDDFYNPLGIVYTGSGYMVSEGVIQPNSDVWERVIPMEKFLILTFNEEDSDPRGRSDMGSIYPAWWKKQQATPAHLSHIATFGQPSVWLELAPDTPAMVTVTNADGTTSQVSATAQGNQALEAFKNGSAMTVPNQAAIHLVEAQGNGEVFLKTFEHEDKQIAKGMLWQTLTTEESAHMARAASGVHQDVFSIMIRAYRSRIEHSLRRLLLTALRYNFPDRYLQYVPEVSLGNPDTQDYGKLWAAAAALSSSGYMKDEEQKQQLDSVIGLPVRSQQSVDRQQALQDAAATAARTLNPGGNQTGSGDGGSPNINPAKDLNPNNEDTVAKAGENG